jgi:hypothetical protein
MTLYQVHWQERLWLGERETLALTGCGKRVVLWINRQRLTREPREITCQARGCAQHKRKEVPKQP